MRKMVLLYLLIICPMIAHSQSLDKTDLYGEWRGIPMGIGAGYPDYYYFNSDDGFSYHSDESDTTNRLISYSGSWSLEWPVLSLAKEKEVVLEGGKLIEDDPIMGEYIQGAKIVTNELDPVLTNEVILSNYILDPIMDDIEMYRMRFDGQKYWQASKP